MLARMTGEPNLSPSRRGWRMPCLDGSGAVYAVASWQRPATYNRLFDRQSGTIALGVRPGFVQLGAVLSSPQVDRLQAWSGTKPAREDAVGVFAGRR